MIQKYDMHSAAAGKHTMMGQKYFEGRGKRTFVETKVY